MSRIATRRALLSRPAAASGVLLANLVAYWRMEDASGDAADAHTGGLTLTQSGTVGSVGGKVGNARQPNSANYLYRGSEAAIQAGDIDFTWAFWLYLASTGVGNQFFLTKDTNTGGAREYTFVLVGASSRLQFSLFRATDSEKALQWTPALTAPAWYFVAAWHDSAADKMWLSVNNAEAQSLDTTGALQAAGAAQLRLGTTQYPTASAFSGYLDEVGFWKRILTADERTFLYNSGSGRTYAEVAAYTG